MKLKAILVSGFLIMAMFSSSFFMNIASGSSTEKKAMVDESLLEAFSTSLEPVEVIVTFQDGTMDSRKDILHDAGIQKGLFLNSLPMAGVLATHDQ